jgi:hypothetical protein
MTYGALLIGGSLVCWFFPLVHIRRLNGGSTSGVSFQLAKETPTTERPHKLEAYTADRKLEAYATGIEMTDFWNAFDRDATAARIQYGRQAGLGGAWYFRIRGRGTVEIVEKDRVVLSVADSSRRVCLELGVVVDNTVREAIGVKASDFANSQDFNSVSSELNRRVEQEVIAPNRALLKKGVVVDFVGCAKIGNKADLDPLCLIPIQLQILDSQRGASIQRGGASFQLAKAPGASESFDQWEAYSRSRKLEAYATGETL